MLIHHTIITRSVAAIDLRLGQRIWLDALPPASFSGKWVTVKSVSLVGDNVTVNEGTPSECFTTSMGNVFQVQG